MSTTISASLVKELREKTGAGIMACRTTLADTGGDLDAAIERLRDAQTTMAAKKADREATEGLVALAVEARRGAIVELNCETDFVARTEEYHAVLNAMTSFVAQSAPAGVTEVGADGAFLKTAYAGSTVDEVVKATSAKTGEAVQLRRIARFTPANGVVGHYLHPNEQVGTLV